MMLRKRLLGLTAAIGALGFGSANAAVWTLAPTSNNDGNTVAASANITTSGDVVTIDLTNLSPSLSAANQALTDFLIDYTTDVSSVSGFTQAGSLINVNADGSTTAVSGNPTRWHSSVVSGNVFLNVLGGGKPNDMIAPGTIGSPNASVLNFNPYVDTTGHFTFTLSGASGLVIKGVEFSFGTENEFVAPGECTSNCGGGPRGGGIPEPTTWALLILGFGGAGAMLRRRRQLTQFTG